MSSGLLKAMGTGDVKWKDNETTKRISRKKRLHNLLTYVRHKITNAMAEVSDPSKAIELASSSKFLLRSLLVVPPSGGLAKTG